MYRGDRDNLRRGKRGGNANLPSAANTPGGSAAKQNPSLIPASIDPAASGMGWKIAYTVYEIPAVTGVPLKTVRREISEGHLPTCCFNAKAVVALAEDIIDWLRRRRSTPASTETRELLKKKKSPCAARRAALPPESDERRRRRAKYEALRRRLEPD